MDAHSAAQSASAPPSPPVSSAQLIASSPTLVQQPSTAPGPTVDPLVAFLDIGTNSVRLLIARLNASGTYTVVFEQKETVRLGAGEFAKSQLQPEAMKRAGLVCARFVEIARSQGVSDVVAVATSATREASNRAQFVRFLKRKAGLDVRVISGREEARLIYLGVASGLNLGDRPALFLDIGGGSTEFIVGDQSQYLFLDSVPLGAIRVADRFFKPGDTGPVGAAAYARIQRYVRTSTARTLQQLRHYRYDGLIASSGTAMNLAEAAMRKHEKRGLRKDDIVSRTQIRDMIRTLCELSLDERRKVPGLNPERADIIIGGAAILETILDELDLSEFRVSERGLREGLPSTIYARGNRPRRPDFISGEVGPRTGATVPVRRTACQTHRAAGLAVVRQRETGGPARPWAVGAGTARTCGMAARRGGVCVVQPSPDPLSLSHHERRTVGLPPAGVGDHRQHGAVPPQIVSASEASGIRGLGQAGTPHRTCAVRAVAIGREPRSGHLAVVQRASLRRVEKGEIELEILPNGDCHLELWELPKHELVFESVFGRKFSVKTLRPVEA